MPEPFVSFSQKDLQKIRAYAQRLRNIPINPVQRSAVVQHSVYADPSQAPEIYIAKIPDDGVPAAEYVGTAGGPPTSLTGAECQVYRLLEEDGQLGIVDSVTQRVYNLSTKEISGTGWILIKRDKFGTYIADAVITSSYGDQPGAGQCSLAKLNSDDCVVITYRNGTTGEVEKYYLRFDPLSSTYKSSDLFLYPGGSGTFELGYVDGRFRLLLGGLELLNCGDGCFTGSWITGHGADETGTGSDVSEPCNATAFTVCLTCGCCPIPGWDGEGWYCVTDDSVGSGTGTGTALEECVVIYLMEEDRCDDEITICSGPYESEAAADAECGAVIPSCCDGDLGDSAYDTLYAHLVNISGCPNIPSRIRLNRTSATSWGGSAAGGDVTGGTGQCAGPAVSASFSCLTGQLQIIWGADNIFSSSTPDSFVCPPSFSAVYTDTLSFSAANTCCDGTVEITINTTP